MSPNHAYNLSDGQCEEIALALKERGWFASQGLVPQALCQDLLKQLKIHQDEGTLTKAGVGQGSNHKLAPEVRGDSVRWLDNDHPTPLENAFQAWLKRFMASLNERLYLGLSEVEIHYAAYPPGAGYEKHVDVFKADSSRLLSFVLYLNEQWRAEDGGELMIFSELNADQLEIKIAPEFSQCVIFLSSQIHHQVNITNKVRFSVTGWLKKPALGAVSPVF